MSESVSGATTFNTVSVTIACPVSVAWWLFLDRAAWQPSFVSREVMRGSDEALGTLAIVRSATEGAANERFEENIYVEPERRIVVRIWAGWTPIVTHADFRFESVPDGCRVTTSIHCWLPGDAAAGADHLQTLTQTKIEDDFNRLKTVAEGRANTPSVRAARAS